MPSSLFLFPNFDRPQADLDLKQIIQQKAAAIANSYPAASRATYQQAATNLRLPYWDWSIHPTMPLAMASKTISINGPNGAVTMNNPLYQYNFPQATRSQFPSGDVVSAHTLPIPYPCSN